MVSNNIMSLEDYLSIKYASQTKNLYLYEINKFLTMHPDAKNFVLSDIVNYLNHLKNNHVRIDARPRILCSIKSYYNYLIEIGEIEAHPCMMLSQRVKKKEIQIQDLFTSKELEQILQMDELGKVLKLRNKIIVSFVIYQAALGSEIISLKLEDIDLDRGTIFLAGNGFVNKRTLRLNSLQVNMLLEYIEEDRKRLNFKNINELIVTIRGEKTTVESINNIFEKIKYVFPDRQLCTRVVRQSVIANMLNERGHQIEDVQLFSGQKWPSTTERYKRHTTELAQKKINSWHPLEKIK